MARGAQFINHKGKEIYYVDYSNIKNTDDFLETIKQTNAFREKATLMGKKNLLMLVDITGSYIYGDVLNEIKRSGKLTKPLTKKEALVGLTGGQKILLQFVQAFTKMQLKVFNNIEEAKEWLIKL